MSNPTVLIYSDSPVATTGLGRVTRGILEMLGDDFTIDVWGINHRDFFVKGNNYTPLWNKEDYKVRTIITPQQYGVVDYSPEAFAEYLKTNGKNYNLVITSCDWNRAWILSEILGKLGELHGTKWAAYIPMDHRRLTKEQTDQYLVPDATIYITKYGVEQAELVNPSIRGKLHQIWHPLDINEFPEVSSKAMKEFKNAYYQIIKHREAYIVGTVNRNFWRKDPYRLVRAFAGFRDQNPDAALYWHGADLSYDGYYLSHIFHILGIKPGQAELTPSEGYVEVHGITQDALNKLYRSFDVFVTASRGEGFGYTTVEALACEVPFIGPRNTSFMELVGDNGYLVDCDDYEVRYEKGAIPTEREVINVNKMIETMNHVRNNSEEAKEKAKQGREWVKNNLSYETIGEQWKQLIADLL